MRSSPALRTLSAVLLTGGAFAAVTTGTTAAALPASGGDGPVVGTVVSRGELNVRQQPTSHSAVVAALAPGSHDRVECKVKGQSVHGTPYWYWLRGAQGWASAAFVDTRGARVPDCADPCPQWKDGHWINWEVSVSGSWSFSASGTAESSGTSETSSGDWEWIPVGR
ncbi:SH3 domain-containing protein [Streptomyces sp. NPDC002588]|uniref:SH3 domain-containing protein n=1 Tax=Streptomyces sp. NPDC002588 TaxID=3154419 RepID=UPI0033256FDC